MSVPGDDGRAGPGDDGRAGPPGGPPSLVVGAHYFLGIHVARALAAEAEADGAGRDRGPASGADGRTDGAGRIRCLVPEPGAVPAAVREAVGPQAEWCRGTAGEGCDVASLAAAMEGFRTVYHCDEDYRTRARDPASIYRHNVEGTGRVLEAARAAGVERVVYTSSVGALGRTGDGTPADETTPARLEEMVGHYQRSKFLAERLVEEKAAEGVPVVVVNPPASVGELDLQPTPVGRLIVDFLSGRVPATMESGRNFLDVRETARGHLLAARRGRPGRRYVLGGENLTVEAFLARLAALTGREPPRWKLPQWVALAFAGLQEGRARLGGGEPRVSLESVRAARQKMFFDTGRAARELGFVAGPLEPALERAVAWFRRAGLLPPAPEGRA